MIITLKKADFSKNNIGTLTTWSISTSYNSSVVEITSGSIPSTVDRTSNTGIQATLTIKEGYELGSAGVTVTMGGSVVASGITVDGNTITIDIASVTGNVSIIIPTKNSTTGEEDNPDTPNAVNLWKYTSSDMDSIMANARYRLANGTPYKEEGDDFDKTYGTTEKIYVNGNSGAYTLDLESGKTYRWQFIPYFEYGFLKLHNPWGGPDQTSMKGKRVFFYKADDTLIQNDTQCLDATGMLVTVPQGAVYMRFMAWGYDSQKSKVKPIYNTLMITEGETEYTEYIPAS